MRIYYHTIVGFLTGCLVISLSQKSLTWFNLFPWIMASFAPDLDHLIRYCIRNKTLKLRKILRLIIEDYKQNNQHFYIFHTIEFMFFYTLVMRRFSNYHYWLSAYLLHIFIDALRHYHLKRNFSWIRKWSFYFNFLK